MEPNVTLAAGLHSARGRRLATARRANGRILCAGLLGMVGLTPADGALGRSPSAGEVRSAAAFLPEGSLVALEVKDPTTLWATLAAGPLGAPWSGDADAPDLVRGLAEIESTLGANLETLLGDLASGGLALGVDFTGRTPTVVLSLRALDQNRGAERLRDVLSAVGRSFGAPRAFETPIERNGARIWRIGEDLTVAQKGTVTLLGTRGADLEEGLERCDDTTDLGPIARPDWQRSREAIGENEGLWALVDVAALRKETTDIDWPALDGLGRRTEGLLTLGAPLALLPRCERLRLGLRVDADGLWLCLDGEGPTTIASDLLPKGPAPAAPLAERTGNLIGALLHRDLGTLAERRGELLERDSLGAFSSALTELEPFFGSLRLGEDVLPRLGDWWEIAVREVPFAADERPELPLPGALLSIGLPDDRRLAEAIEAAFQSAVAISNVEGAQEGRAPLLLNVRQHNGHSYSLARPLSLAPGEPRDLRFNLVPAMAVWQNRLLVASHAALIEEALDGLDGGLSGSPGSGEHLRVDGAALAAWAGEQRAALLYLARLTGRSGARVDPWLDWLAGADLELRTAVKPEGLRVEALLHLRR